MDTLPVKTESKKYRIYFAENFEQLADAMKSTGIKKNKIMIAADDIVAGHYLKELRENLLKTYEEVSEFIFPHGEQNKNLETISAMYKAFLDARLDRRSVVVALGGGVTGDMAGFAAATYMRGIRFIQVPTTLLSQVDSSVGGKTGVDFLGNKNLIGVFCQPELVYINLATLRTLPNEHFISGLAESLKCGYIADSEYLHYISENSKALCDRNERVIETVIQGSCKIKAAVVSQDEKETGLREILNFGHTFGHAIETVTDFSIPHGCGVALGMLCAMQVSVWEGGVTQKEFDTAKELFTQLGLPVAFGVLPLTKEQLSEKIYEQMFNDKKTEANKLRLILLSRAGEAYAKAFEDKDMIIKAIKGILD